MSFKSEIAHRVIRRVGIEDATLALVRHAPWAIKLLPLAKHFRRGEFVEVLRDGVRFSVDRSDYMQWCIWADLVDWNWKHCLRRHEAGTTVIDVGSNVGAFCLKVAHALRMDGGPTPPPASVVAVEANPTIAGFLRRNMALNPSLTSLVDVWEVALGAENGHTEFEVDLVNTGGGRMATGSSASTFRVPMRRLDDMVREKGVARVGVLKVDVEGFEPEVLAGSEETLGRDRPTLYLEVSDAWLRKREHSARSMLEGLRDRFGYRFSVDEGRTLSPLDLAGSALEDRIARDVQFNVLGERAT